MIRIGIEIEGIGDRVYQPDRLIAEIARDAVVGHG